MNSSSNRGHAARRIAAKRRIKRLLSDFKIVVIFQVATVLGIIGAISIGVALVLSVGELSVFAILLICALAVLAYFFGLEKILEKIASGFISALIVLALIIIIALTFTAGKPILPTFISWMFYGTGLLWLTITPKLGPAKSLTYASGFLALIVPFMVEERVVLSMYIPCAFLFGYLAISTKDPFKNPFRAEAGISVVLAGTISVLIIRELTLKSSILAVAGFGTISILTLVLSELTFKRFKILRREGLTARRAIRENPLLLVLLITGVLFLALFSVGLVYLTRLVFPTDPLFLIVISSFLLILAISLGVISMFSEFLATIADPMGCISGVFAIGTLAYAGHEFLTFSEIFFVSALAFVTFLTVTHFVRKRGGVWTMGMLAACFGLSAQFSIFVTAPSPSLAALSASSFFAFALLLSMLILRLHLSPLIRILQTQDVVATLMVIIFVMCSMNEAFPGLWMSAINLLGLGACFLLPAIPLFWLAFKLSR